MKRITNQDDLQMSWSSNVLNVTHNLNDFVNYTKLYYDAHDPRKLI